MSSGPDALNGLIFESKFVKSAELIAIECKTGVSCLCAVGKYDVSSVVKTEEKCWFNTSYQCIFDHHNEVIQPEYCLSFYFLCKTIDVLNHLENLHLESPQFNCCMLSGIPYVQIF